MKNKVFCEVCTKAKNMGAPLPSTAHNQESVKAFVRDGFFSWAKALETFQTHKLSNLHHAAASTATAAKAGINVAASISAGKFADDRCKNSFVGCSVISSVHLVPRISHQRKHG